jgi:Tol biopolymer transport system component
MNRGVDSIMMKKIAMLLILTLSMSFVVFNYAASKDKSGQNSLSKLASEIKGSVIYTRNNHVYKVIIGDWKPKELGRGEYARWNIDGKRIAVYDRRRIYVMKANGSERKLVTDEAWRESGCPIEFHPNGKKIIFIRRKRRGFWAVNIWNGKMRKLVDIKKHNSKNKIGEPGISADGKHIVYRLGRNLYAADLADKKNFIYAKSACSSGISPNGKWIMNNRGNHESMNIRSWNGKKVSLLKANICRPDGKWDNHTWSNHNDYICAEGDKTGDSYVINISTKVGTRITQVGNTNYPDLYLSKLR